MQQCAPTTAGDLLAKLEFRTPNVSDGAAIWDLVRANPVLDTNSCYAYLLLCRHYAQTCIVAYRGDLLAGCVTAYIPPRQPNVLFVWQIVVHPQMAKRGLGKQLLREALALPACSQVRYLEATVSPSNEPSRRMFRSLAGSLRAPFRVVKGFTCDDFPTQDHEEEPLIRIGPWEPDYADVSGT